MRRFLSILFVMSILAVLGQGIFVSWNRFTPSASPFNPSNLGPAYWWVSEDIPIDAVTNWPDRMVGFPWTNGAVSQRPTNTSTGVDFTRAASNGLTNSGVDLSANSNNAIFMVISLNSGGFFQSALSIDRVTFSGSIGFDTGDILYVYLAPALVSSVAISLSTWYSLVIVQSTPSLGVVFYTNGIPAKTNSSPVLFGTTLKSFGGDNGNGYLDANVRELAIWTNVSLTSLQVSNLHNYATNKYGFAP